MNKLLAVVAVAMLAVLVAQPAVVADEGVAVGPAPGQPANAGQGGQTQAHYYAAYAPPAPVPPGVASFYSVPCTYIYPGRTDGTLDVASVIRMLDYETSIGRARAKGQ